MGGDGRRISAFRSAFVTVTLFPALQEHSLRFKVLQTAPLIALTEYVLSLREGDVQTGRARALELLQVRFRALVTKQHSPWLACPWSRRRCAR
jgi:hypothetical protein